MRCGGHLGVGGHFGGGGHFVGTGTCTYSFFTNTLGEAAVSGTLSFGTVVCSACPCASATLAFGFSSGEPGWDFALENSCGSGKIPDVTGDLSANGVASIASKSFKSKDGGAVWNPSYARCTFQAGKM